MEDPMSTRSHVITGLTMLLLATFLMAPELPASEGKSGDTKVYHAAGKKRVHIEGCRRLPVDRDAYTKMTMAEADKKGLPLCSRCPGSTTQGKGNAAPEAVSKEETTVFYIEGKKRVHVNGCRRLPDDRDELSTMTLAEAEKKDLPLCSRCPGSTTEAKPKE